MNQTGRIATVQILVDLAVAESEACDYIHELLEGTQGIRDWGYLKQPLAKSYFPPEPYVFDPRDYEEGDFLPGPVEKQFRELAAVAQLVVDRWENGDLADAVRKLDSVLREMKGAS